MCCCCSVLIEVHAPLRTTLSADVDVLGVALWWCGYWQYLAPGQQPPASHETGSWVNVLRYSSYVWYVGELRVSRAQNSQMWCVVCDSMFGCDEVHCCGPHLPVLCSSHKRLPT
jgi:hypothetical protein